MRDLASCARAWGLRSPAIRAAIMSRPDIPKMSLATTDSFSCASSSSFSTRFFSAPWSETKLIRYLVRSRSRRIGIGGTKLGCRIPVAAQSGNSQVLRPGARVAAQSRAAVAPDPQYHADEGLRSGGRHDLGCGAHHPNAHAAGLRPRVALHQLL